jgi:hypothetical protein
MDMTLFQLSLIFGGAMLLSVGIMVAFAAWIESQREGNDEREKLINQFRVPR